MKHPTALPSQKDPADEALFRTSVLVERVEKSMALLFLDGEPVCLVLDYYHLWLALETLYKAAHESKPYGFCPDVSVLFGPSFSDGFSLNFPADIWFACCEDQDRMTAYFEICGYIETDGE